MPCVTFDWNLRHVDITANGYGGDGGGGTGDDVLRRLLSLFVQTRSASIGC